MDTLTIIIIVIFVAALIAGGSKGFVKQLGSFAAIIAAIIACRVFMPQATALAAQLLGVSADGSELNRYICVIAGCAGVFLIVWMLVWLLSRMIHRAITVVKLGPLNAIAGALFMAFKWMLVISLALNAWMAVSPDTQALARPSSVVEAVESIAPKTLGFIKHYTTELQPKTIKQH
ncbi:MAG: CvpA family protein [Paramuribaculum sp.]|jgi:uncharacterized membrane protein required for colicin V production